MRVKWLGHSAFLLTAGDGTRIITDPYVPGCFDKSLRYEAITEECDAVTVSHGHDDHAGARFLPGNPKVIRGAVRTEVRSVKVAGFDTAHDDTGGSKRGRNTVYRFEIDGLVVCHLGDLGEPLNRKVAMAVGPVDVLMVPVGGFFTIDAGQALRAAAELSARVVIPMHYRTDKCSLTIEPVDGFIRGRAEARRLAVSEVEISKDRLPAKPEIWVLEHAL